MDDFFIYLIGSFAISQLIAMPLLLISNMKIWNFQEKDWAIASYRATIIATIVGIVSLFIVILMLVTHSH